MNNRPSKPGALPLAGARNTEFRETIDIEGVDLSTATFKMHVRLYPDAPGVPLVDLSETAPPANGVSFTGAMVGAVYVSSLQILISKATMQTLPPPAEAGGDAVLHYDLIISGGAFDEAVWFRGTFTVEGSVTR